MTSFCNICVIVLLVFSQQVYLKEINLMFDGQIVDSQTHVTLSISCSTQTLPFECSMEFLHNNATVEIIRYSDSGCFNQYGRCETETCACSEDCTSFHWNLTTASVLTNDSFGCNMRIQNSNSNSFFKVYTLVVYNGTGFTSARSVINPVNTVTTPLMLEQEMSLKRNDDGRGDVAIGIILGLVFIIACVSVYVVYSRKSKDKKHKKMEKIQMDDVSTL
ncbi:uncharacterized protein LOC127710757 [Mytilus californianus]|uniref:uncharacterized protein LOC127710757 n=1 Tax=Mytilus californianus TaxID=6549 RepID=UPI002248089C|nr:uncharacterized protein LOC127710757 [Mytilus californianus]